VTGSVVAGQVWRDHGSGFGHRVIVGVHEHNSLIFARYVLLTPAASGKMVYERGEVTCDELRATCHLVYDATLIDPHQVTA